MFALTESSEFVIVEQKGAGILNQTLETPGGVVDPGELPEITAKRELEEKLATRARNLIKLGVTHPNPAILNNKLHMFLALDCYCLIHENTTQMRQNRFGYTLSR